MSDSTIEKFIIRDTEVMELSEMLPDTPLNIRRLLEVNGRVKLVIMRVITPSGRIEERHGYFLPGGGDIGDEYHMTYPPRIMTPPFEAGDQLTLEEYPDEEEDDRSDRCDADDADHGERLGGQSPGA